MQRSVSKAARLAGGTDTWLLLAFLALTSFGLLMVYSASIAASYADYGTPTHYFVRDVIWVGIGLVGLLFATRIDYHRYESFALPLLGFSVLMLMAVLTPHLGHTSNGARRWFSLGAGVTVEPSEITKLAVVLYLAAWLSKKGESVRDFKTCFVPFAVITGFICLLIVRQPDLGTTIVVAATMLSIYFIAGADLKHIALAGGGAVCVAWVLAHSSSYRYDRLMAFTNPWSDPYRTGFHTVQALMALGAGGVFGTGFGNSVQKAVLPAPHTDSILAVIGEELGLVGTVGVLLLYLVIAYRGVRISMAAPDRLGRLLASGITCWITLQALLNYGVITSSVPFTGVPLPFVSYGGTALIISMAAMGILLNISRYATGEARARQSSDYGRRDGGTRVPRVVDHPAPDRSRGRRRQPAGATFRMLGKPKPRQGSSARS
jgi:cell division protein FtsW